MTPPILQPPPLERLAYLKPGDRLGPHVINVVMQGRSIRSQRIERDGKSGRRIREGDQLTVQTTDGTWWCEHLMPYHRPLSDLLPYAQQLSVTAPSGPSVMLHAIRAQDMQQRAGFRFYPAQLRYLLDVAQHDGALLAAEVGCGKTCLAIGLTELHRPKRTLIIAPQGVIAPRRRKVDDEWCYDASQWQREFARFAPWMQPRYVTRPPTDDGVFLTYMQDALLNDGGWLRDVPPDWFDCIICDEVHLVMNPHTHMARALYRMQPRLRYALTATPIPNRAQECWQLCGWLRPGTMPPMPTTREWLEFDDGTASQVHDPVEPFSTLLFGQCFRHVIAPIRKRDIRPDLPELHVHNVLIDAEPELMDQYRKLAAEFTLPEGDSGTIERAKLTALRNLCASSKAKAASLYHALSQVKHSVVVSARTQQTTMLVRLLAGRRTARIDSLTDPKQHGSYSAAFQRGELDCLFMGIKCAYGHSFPDCNTLHVASLEWSYGAFEQACGRVYRINSQRPVHAYVYLLRGTVEERMFDTVCLKRSVANRILFGDEQVAAPALAVA